MFEISKELLSEVLNCDVDKYTIVSSSEITQIRIWKKDTEMWNYISYDIHHLAHKCKEWANKQGYSMSVHQSEFSGYVVELNYGFSIVDFHNKLEVEAIIKASEWILKEIKK